ncbi:RING zinc finger [Botrytis cinerea]
MGKRQFKSQASSTRASTATGAGFGFGFTTKATRLSYLTEPSNLSAISDANVILSFKNLSKKDATTKSKALEDLRTFVQNQPNEQGGTEEAILEAWVDAYPRISIDNSRRVRELSHSIQYELLKSARKRMERYIPKVVGSWLAGTYDRDRAVARSAMDGLTSFLDTDAKMNLFWKRCQNEILDYAEEALNETPNTLSDERSVPTEEANEKYFRVNSASVSLLANLLAKLGDDDMLKYQDRYEKVIFGNKKLWTLASCEDATARKSTDKLLVLCLEKQTQLVENNLGTISRAFISEALRSSQLTSALQLLQTLHQLTKQFPQVWTSAYKAKRSTATGDLISFVQKGSQGSSPAYWQTLRALVAILPISVLPQTPDSILEFLEVFRKSINQREESRANSSEAWLAYGETSNICIVNLPSSQQAEIVQKSTYPMFAHYLHPSPETSEWLIRNNTPSSTISAFISRLGKNSNLQNSLAEEWQKLAQEFVTRIQTSMPEQSKDYSSSQDAVMAEGHRWFSLLSDIFKLKDLTVDQNPLLQPSGHIIDSTLQLMEASPSVLETVKSFMETHLPKLLLSPSSSYLTSSLDQFRLISGQQDSYKRIYRDKKTITALISSNDISDLVRDDQALQDLLLETSRDVVEGNNDEWALFEAAVIFNGFSKPTERLLLQNLISVLNASNPNVNHVFQALELLSKRRPEAIRDGDAHVDLITKLLALTELSDSDLGKRATNLRSVVDNESGATTSSVVHILRENLENANPQSLTIDTLVQQAEAIITTLDDSSHHPELFPNATKWSEALAPLLDQAPNPTLGVMRPFAGAVFLARAQSGNDGSRPGRDLDGYSVALRMAMYSAHLIRDHPDRLSKDALVEIIYLMCLTVELANDQLDLLENNKLFVLSSEEAIAGVRDFVDRIYQDSWSFIVLHSKAWQDGFESGSPLEFSGVVHTLISKLINTSCGNTSTSFYSARVLSHLLPKLVEQHGWQVGGEDWISSLDILKSSTSNIFGAVAILTGLHETLSSSQLETLGRLVLLNATLSVYDNDDLPVAQNRLVFAVKQILSWTPEISDTNYQLSSESCLALQKLLPAIKSVYGSYWEKTLEFCIKIWESMENEDHQDQKLPMMGMALKLFSNLQSLQDANDDLEDARAQYGETASHCLIKLTKLPRSKSTQPIEFVDNILSRLVINIPSSHINDISEFYPLVASENRMVQSAAFSVLHRAIPAEQAEISVNVLLEKKDAQLPEELLSLLLDAPSIRNFDDEELAEFPPSIRSYLLSWHLVYDAFSTASWKVRKDYCNHLQSENCLGSFLTFLFDVLGHSDGTPLNLEKAHFDESYIRAYDTSLADGETNERNFQWLLIHLYHLCLRHTGDLAKAWFSDCQSKQTRQAVETWTEKYFTPLLISDKLDEIDEWATSKEAKEGGEKELEIKTSKGARSIFASYEIDDTSIQIAIRFPSNYPFYNVKVEGINRVAVPEKKWRSWLLIVQGAITFSNGSLIDGLTTFRRNVEGSLKGHTECAICYSIISSDKKTPDKKCGTCKNTFHGQCLFKWFASSNQSSCPLCRCAFNYGR